MALLFSDSFGHYNALSTKYETVTGASLGSAAARFGSQGLNLTGSGQWVRKNLGTNASTLYAGCAFRVTSAIQQQGTGFIGFADSGTVQVNVRISNTGVIYVTRGGTNTSPTITVLPGLVNGLYNTWHYIELGAFFSSSSGIIYVRLDNGTIYTVTGLNTITTANAFAGQLVLGDTPGSSALQIDDVYCCDNTGNAPWNTFLGDIKVLPGYPTSAGSNAAFTPTGAAANFNCVGGQAADQGTNDGDTTYVSSNTNGQTDTYNFTQRSGSISIMGVVLWYMARVDDATNHTFQGVCISNGTTQNGATLTVPSTQTTYSFYLSQVFQSDPGQSPNTPWTMANLNAAQFGQEELS